MESVIENNKLREDLISDIPTIKKVINSLGSRIKRLGETVFILEQAIQDIQSYATEEGQKKLKQETYNYVISSLRKEMSQHKGKKVEHIEDIMKMLPIKMFKNSGRKNTKEE